MLIPLRQFPQTQEQGTVIDHVTNVFMSWVSRRPSIPLTNKNER